MSSFQCANDSKTAGGTIYGGRFVSLSTSSDFTVNQSTTGSAVYGISVLGTRTPLVTNLADAGDSVGVYTNGQHCWVQAGDTIAAGDLLKPDVNGKAVPGSATKLGARALQAGTVDAYIKVEVLVQDLS